MDYPFLKLEFWLNLLEQYGQIGIAAPILLAALESLIPPLPLVAIVTLNIAAYGVLPGVVYSWIGSSVGCTIVFFFMRLLFRKLLARTGEQHERIRKARQWVNTISVPVLFLIIIMPFTPSAFMNFAFGVSDYSAKRYLLTLYAAKIVMISLLGLFGQSFVSAFQNPLWFLLAIALIIGLYILSARVTRKYHVDSD